MRLAYIVLAHTAPGQLRRLVERLDGDHARFLIHIDKRAPASVHDDATSALGSNPRVTFVRRRTSRLTTFGLVAAPLDALQLLVRERDGFDYAVLLSGQDYPLKPTEAILAHFERARAACFLYTFPMDDPSRSDWEPTELRRYRDRHFWIGGRHLSVRGTRTVPGGLEPFGGSMYWALPREAVLYVVGLLATQRRLVRFFRHTFIPDEMFFQTILMNSHLRDRVTTLEAPCCYGVHYIRWRPRQPHPETLRTPDLPDLRTTPALFARKFDPAVDAHVLDAIDRELLGRPSP
jgi:Core-2/I-Branching enzyme